MKKQTTALAVAFVAAALGATSGDDSSTWLTYGKNHAGWRHSSLSQVNTSNVARLAPEWTFQTGVAGKNETTPLVFDRQMFLTAPSNHAFALDIRTGRRLWHYSAQPPAGINLCCGQVNRGFATLGDTLFKVNIEATLVALDRKTGLVVWESKIEDFKKGYSATVSPLVVRDRVLVGIGGAEFGTRGFVDAYDARSGKRLWRFWTVPAPGEPGGDTWSGDSWRRGGGSTWITGTFDPELNLVYWGTGNPGPDMYGDERAGDNLYTCSLLALDPDTGRLRWHYQFTPHDIHDWDSTSDPVLIDVSAGPRRVKAVVMANRNGFLYALDRTNGKLLYGKLYTKVTWAEGIGADGRPKLVAGREPTEDGNHACPGLGGGHNWQATTYSPQTGLYYFTSTEGCQLYYKTRQDYIEGQWYQGSTATPVPAAAQTGAIVAADPGTGEIRWKFEMVTPPASGLLSTAGGLVFAGDAEGYVFALDARTGKPLWHYQTGGAVGGPPIAYAVDGKQYVAVAAGSSIFTFTLRP
jgi:alcohol dehydrogenase (cytochrome c)